MIKGISHLTFIVKDIEKATLFFTKIFQAKVLYDSGERTFSLAKERFFEIGGLWVAVMRGHPQREKTYEHVAFAVHGCDLAPYKRRIEALGLEMRPPRARIPGEGHSLYFYDYDNHLFELHTGELGQRLEAYQAT